MKRRTTQSSADVLRVLESADYALSHDTLLKKIKDYDRATIYRILNRFRNDGIVHRIMGADGKQYFAVCRNCQKDNHRHDHIHFQCNKCKKVECLAQEPRIDLPKGYILENFNGLVSGFCRECG